MKRLSFLLILAMSVTFAMAQNGRTLYDFENGTTQGWTAIDADGDGYNWALHAPDGTYTSDVGHNESSYYFNSASYDNDSGTALSPNNFLVSPQVTLGGTITFWAQAQDPSYAAEHFGVAVSTTSATNPSAFTTIQEWTMTAKGNTGIIGNHKTRSGNRTTNTWYEYTVDLSAYSGQGYVAIRHFNCTDQFILNVDDITIEAGGGGGTTPEGAITFEDQQIPSSWNNDATYPWVVASPTGYPGYHGSYCMMSGNTGVGNSTSSMEATVNFVQNGSISFLAGCWGEGSSDTYDWDKCRFYIDGQIQFDYGAHQSWELMTYEVSAGSHTFTWTYKKDNSVNPDGDFFGVDDVTFVGAGSGGGGSESIIYDFENSTTQGWTTIDADGDGYTWVLGSAIGGIYLISGASLAGSGHNASNDLMCSGSYRNLDAGGGEVLTPDNYLVSPQVALGGSIDFWACGQDAGYAAEHFGVAVSTTNNTNPSAFTVLQQWTLTAKGTRYEGPRGNRDQGTWYHFTVDLSAYAGQTGYIAIRHFNCSDQFILDIDDITIVEGSGSSTQTYTITATPNPLEGGYITIAYRGDRDVIFSDNFETGIGNWTLIDADGDGNNWYDLIDNNPNNIPGHNGSIGFATSASYTDVALTPDNYLVSPQVALNGTFSFWACAQDASWAAEHFGVAVSTTNNTSAAAFTTVQQWTLTAKSGSGVRTSDTRDGVTRDQGAWYQFSVDLSNYAGQMGYIAIRHFGCTDMFRIVVDDVELSTSGGGGQTGQTVTGQFNEGQTCILTAIPFTGYHFVNWTENGTVVSTNAVYSFTVTGDRTLIANFSNDAGQTYTITATPNPLEGGYITIDYRGNRDVVFSDDFETGIGNWTLIDADGDGQNWYDLIDDNPNNIPGHNGSAGFATSASYNGAALTPDNYLVSPQVALNGTFSFWACAQDASWAAEHFGVAVSTTNNTSAAAFTTVQQWTLTAKSGSGVRTSDTRDGMTRDQGAWYQFSVDLSNYAGQMGYIAIRHFGCTDMFRIVVDDVELTTEGQAGGTVSGVFNEGQTCILTAIPFTGYHFVNWTENGTVVSTNSVYSFTVTSDRNLIANFANNSGQTYTITATPNPLEGGYITIAYRGERDQMTYDFEDSSLQGWTTIDGGSPAGYGWQLISQKIGTGYGHNASVDGVLSQSYDNDYGVVYPDNYLISPQITLGGSISFWACGQDAGYAAEHFGVAGSTTNNTSASAFTTIQEWTIAAKGTRYDGPRGNRDQSTWTLYTADLSAYSGQGYVAIRHFNCSDQFYLDVDDITIVEGGGSGGEMGETVSGTFEEGQTCVLSAFPFTGYHFVNWTENGAVVSTESVYSFVVTSDRNLVANFSNEPTQTYTITATPNPLEGGYITIAYRGERDEFFYDFEGDTQGWTTIDADGDGYNWQLGSVLMAGYVIPSHGDGADCMSSQSYDGSAGPLTPDNYLVSPQVQLGGSISFWACAQDESYAAEHFGVAVSTTNNTNASAFTTLQEWTMTAKSAGNPGNYATRSRVGREGTWYEYTVDLSSYAGQTGYIAIRHFNCTDMFYLDVDDITIVEGTGGGETGETVSAVFEEGQTCVLTAIPFSGYYFVNWTENGTEVANTAVYSFVVTSDRNLVANFSQQPAESYTINAVADPTVGGTVTGAGTYAYGTEITLGVTLNTGYEFEYWTEGGVIVSYDQDYTFTVTGNRDLVACLKFNDGVGEHNISVAIYPNPVIDKLNVEATEAIEQIEVFNINGAKVFSKKNYTEKAEINTTNLPAGTYVIRMTTKSAAEVRSFVKF